MRVLGGLYRWLEIVVDRRPSQTGNMDFPAFVASFLLHLFCILLLLISNRFSWEPDVSEPPIRMEIRERPVAIEPRVESKPVVIEKPVQKKTVPALDKVKPRRAHKKPTPVQGLSSSSFSDKSSGLSAPMGNTLLTKDENIRTKEIEALDEDLSSPAKLIRNTFEKPAYTDEALDAGIEGRFTIDVFVDALGNVLEAELRKPIGYGMDPLLLQAARIAKFEPRKNKLGRAIKGWHEIKVVLRLP